MWTVVVNMKLLAKVEIKVQRFKKLAKTRLHRKLILYDASALKEALALNSDGYLLNLNAIYDSKPQIPKFLPRNNRDRFLYNGSFHEAVGKVFIVAQCFALMPVKGVTAPNPSHLSFEWSNFRTIFCLFFILSTLFDSCLTLFKVFNGAISFNNIEPLIFRACILLVLISGLNLARKWHDLMMDWQQIEDDLPQYVTQAEKSRMAHTIVKVTMVGMMLSLAEHLLSLLSAVNHANFCHQTDDPIKNFMIITNQQIFYMFNYSSILALWGKWQNVYSTFIWNYMDIFVMIISIGLASKFRQLNDNLQKFKGMHMAPSFWTERRRQYRSICTLCGKMDNSISLITMVSFSNNLYFICVQLLRSLNTMPSVAHAVYFYFSLSFLIGRTLAVSLYSASVNDESRRTLRYLRCVPKDSWCSEVKRFAEEICSDFVALSGMKFFHLTRKLVLSVAGTIVTYELVLIQFHEDTDLWVCENSNKSI